MSVNTGPPQSPDESLNELVDLQAEHASLNAALDASNSRIKQLEFDLEATKKASQIHAQAHQTMHDKNKKLEGAYQKAVADLEVELQKHKDNLEYAKEKTDNLAKAEEGHKQHIEELKKGITRLEAILETKRAARGTGYVCELCHEHIDRLDNQVKDLTERYNQVVARAQSLHATHSSQIHQLRLAARLKHTIGLQHQIHALVHLHSDIKAIRADFLAGLLASG